MRCAGAVARLDARRGAALLLAAAASLAARAETLLLEPVADATLIEEPAGALANGAGARLFVGRVGANAGSTRRRALLRFDLAALPPGAQLQSVSLTLSLERSRQAGDLPMSLHRITQAWNEGPSASMVGIGEPTQPGDVTWLQRLHPALPWTSPGGDFAAVASATRIVGATGGPVTWASTPQLIADVQAWQAHPAANHGWMLVGFEGGGTSAKGFAAREASVPAERPLLRIDYLPATSNEADVPLPPWALAALGLGLAGLLTRRRHRPAQEHP